MIDVLVARCRADEVAIVVRLHRDAGLRCEVIQAGLDELTRVPLPVSASGAPSAVAFCAEPELSPQLLARLRAVAAFRHAHPRAVVVAVFVVGPRRRARRSSTAVLLLDAGVDEVVRTDIDPVEYAARLRAVARRRGWQAWGSDLPALTPGMRPQLDVAHRRLWGSRGIQSLTAKECIVMSVILESDAVATRSRIGDRLWTDGWQGTGKAIDNHVANLRRKLREVSGDEWEIRALRGSGFLLVSATATEAASA